MEDAYANNFARNADVGRRAGELSNEQRPGQKTGADPRRSSSYGNLIALSDRGGGAADNGADRAHAQHVYENLRKFDDRDISLPVNEYDSEDYVGVETFGSAASDARSRSDGDVLVLLDNDDRTMAIGRRVDTILEDSSDDDDDFIRQQRPRATTTASRLSDYVRTKTSTLSSRNQAPSKGGSSPLEAMRRSLRMSTESLYSVGRRHGKHLYHQMGGLESRPRSMSLLRVFANGKQRKSDRQLRGSDLIPTPPHSPELANSRSRLETLPEDVKRSRYMTGKNRVKIPCEGCYCHCKSPSEVLQTKDGTAAFRLFLRSEYNEEHLNFWLECECYNTLKISKQQRKAAQIYAKYLAPDSPHEIDVDGDMREEIVKQLFQPTPQLFDAVQQLIYQRMATDSFPRFLASKHAHRCRK